MTLKWQGKGSGKDSEDTNLQDWQEYIHDVKPLPNSDKRRHFLKKARGVDPDQIHQQRRREYYETQRQSLLTETPATNHTRKLIRVSKVIIEARIDLHGFTKDQAQQQLQFFLMNAQIQRKIWVLVITGKGRPETGITLQSIVPKWLDSLPYVSGYTQAKAINGGAGALYVRLKKLRD